MGNQSTYRYNENFRGLLAESTNPRGYRTFYEYDGVGLQTGNLTGIRQQCPLDQCPHITSFDYGAEDSVASVLGVPASVTDPQGHTTDFSYDAMGRTTRIDYRTPLTPPDTTRTSVAMAYNALGQAGDPN